MKITKKITSVAIAAVMLITCFGINTAPAFAAYTGTVEAFEYNGISIPAYSGNVSEAVNGNVPLFTEAELQQGMQGSYEKYGSLDSLGRCTAAMASLDWELKPDWTRGSISQIKPTGWHQNFYDFLSGDGHIYERCHLIAFMFTGVDCDNDKSMYAAQDLITGTGYMNSGSGKSGMLRYENQVNDYLYNHRENHVLYRVTPVFLGNDLMARGVLMEAQSLETDDISFCVFCYNVQPGVEIDYATGENRRSGSLVDMDSCSVSIPQSSYVYTGKQLKPAVTVKSKGTRLEAGKDYRVSYGVNKQLGKGTVKVTGLGNYTGSRQLTFKIIPKSTSISKLTRGRGSITVKWRRQKVQTTGYQIQYSTKKSFSSAKKVTVRKNTTALKTIKKLKRKKTYYVRIRTYKSGGYYSRWSSVKKIRTR